MGNLQGKNAVVTGGTRGIGVAIAIALLERGARVMICARKADEVERKVQELRCQFGAAIFGAVCDVANAGQVQSLFAKVAAEMGGVDLLLNNAGVGAFQKAAETSVEEWDRTIGTNLSGVFYCCREAIPQMRQRGGGYIINIGSLAGKQAFAGASAYCATKFGLVGFSEALMQEVRYDHIKVSYVMPGSVNTSFGRHQEEDPANTWKLTPEDVAQVVIDLLEMNPRALPSRVELRPSEPKASG
ncbi:MAG: SDR family oxidoreductase [Acidobacteria bacterium]|nr:SDR family oxidoreductase [Acidobacteriota bacterium]